MSGYREPDELPDDGTRLVYDYSKVRRWGAPAFHVVLGVSLASWPEKLLSAFGYSRVGDVVLGVGLLAGLALALYEARRRRELDALGLTTADLVIRDFDRREHTPRR